MKYIVRYSYWSYGPIQGGSCAPYVQSTQMNKILLFHNKEDVDNWIRNNIIAATLIKLEIEYATVE